MKKYQIILADPPWKMDFSVDNSRKCENHYPTMETEEICNLKVPSDDNSVLFLWATAPKLLEALKVMEAWGFKYRTHFIWDKEVFGLGYWCRGQHELLLIGKKGKFSPPKNTERISSVIRIKRAKHSDKPDYVKIMISKWYPNYSKLEMFYRSHTPLFPNNDWDVWGNELKNDIELECRSLI